MENLQRLNLISGVSTVSDGSSKSTEVTPFFTGTVAVAKIYPLAFTGTVTVQTSEDGTTWTTATTQAIASASDATIAVDVTLKQYARAQVTARTAGSVSIDLEA